MVNLRLNGTGMVTILQVHTYCEVWSQCAALHMSSDGGVEDDGTWDMDNHILSEGVSSF
jgi:hypothetical protein